MSGGRKTMTMREKLTQELTRLHAAVCGEWCGGDPGGAGCSGDCRDAASVAQALEDYRREILRDAAQYIREVSGAASHADYAADVLDPDVDIAGYVGLRRDGQ